MENLKPESEVRPRPTHPAGANLKLDLVGNEILLDLRGSLVSFHQLLIVGSHDLKGDNL